MKNIQIGSVSIPLDSYATSGSAVLGIKGAGKTWLAKGLAEQLLDYSVPIIAFDAIGVWRYLKVPCRGRDTGYKVVVAGGHEPDLPLTPQSAPEIVRAAIRENIPLVIDLYDKRLSKADWRRIVQGCFRTLLYENKGVRHIFLEEAAEFIPQKVMDGETYAEVEKLVRMGGNASLGITLINQRAQEINKAVLELCENLVLMRQRGVHAIDSLEKWLDRISPEQSKEITTSMPTMGPGDAWVFAGDADRPLRTTSGKLNSYHPDRKRPETQAQIARAADPSDFVQRLSGELSKLLEDAKANDPATLKKQIAELQRELLTAKRPLAVQEVPQERLREAEARGFKAGQDSVYPQFRAVRDIAAKLIGDVSAIRAVELPEWQAQPADWKKLNSEATKHWGEPIPIVYGKTRMAHVPLKSSNGAGEPMPKVQRSFLVVLAQREGRPTTRNQIAVFAGYSSKSGHIDNALSALRTAGYAQGGSDDVRITAEGLRAIGDFEPLPSGEALRRYWLQNAGGKAASAMLGVIFDAWPDAITRDEVAERAGYSVASGHIDNTLSRLRTLDLVTGGSAAIRASEDLFT